MTPSLEIREHAAKLFDAMAEAEDTFRALTDEGQSAMIAWMKFANANSAYIDFCKENGFRLVTDASNLFLRCAETNIPLCDLDECIETETGQLMIVKQAA